MQDEVPIEELWRNRIAPTLGFSPDASVSDVPQGYPTRVYYVETAEGSFVLRAYPSRSLSRRRNYSEANRYFHAIGFHVPATIGEGREGEIAWLLEERLEGRHFRDLLGDPAAIRRAAESLARLHGVERGRYGEAGGWGGFRLTLRWRQRFTERWSKIVRLFPELQPIAGEVETWFQDWTDTFSPPRYQLLHGEYRPDSLCLLSNDEVAFLDLRTPRFGFGLLELLEALHHFTGEEAEDWTSFLEPYFEKQTVESKDLFGEFGESLHAVFHLRQADRFADLAVGDRGGVEDRRRWECNAWDSWLRFAKLARIESPRIAIETKSPFPTRGMKIAG